MAANLSELIIFKYRKKLRHIETKHNMQFEKMLLDHFKKQSSILAFYAF